MADHKSRNWQRLMRNRADMVAETMIGLPVRGDIDPQLALANRFREAYVLGYRDGRDSKKGERS